jgi:hypothetical protein
VLWVDSPQENGCQHSIQLYTSRSRAAKRFGRNFLTQKNLKSILACIRLNLRFGAI